MGGLRSIIAYKDKQDVRRWALHHYRDLGDEVGERQDRQNKTRTLEKLLKP